MPAVVVAGTVVALERELEEVASWHDLQESRATSIVARFPTGSWEGLDSVEALGREPLLEAGLAVGEELGSSLAGLLQQRRMLLLAR